MGDTQSKEESRGKYEEEPNLSPLWIGLGVGGGALLSIIAAPFVIAGIGFGAGGIAAGSLAAAWMSASGPVAAGSLIAILQSIGAAGMGAASMGVAAAAGGVVGGTIATGISLAALNESKSGNDESSSKKIRKNSASYKFKAEELKRLFKDVPSNEWLIIDYSGALMVDELLIQGRMFLTFNYFCFYSKSNGKEISRVICFRDIVGIRKESHSSNILQFRLTTEYGKNVFVNLEASEDSYGLLISIWKKSRNSVSTTPIELIKMITDLHGMDLGFRGTEEAMAYFVPCLNEN